MQALWGNSLWITRPTVHGPWNIKRHVTFCPQVSLAGREAVALESEENNWGGWGRNEERSGGKTPFAFWWGVDLAGLAEAYAGPYFPPAASKSPLVSPGEAEHSYHFWHGGARKRERGTCRGRECFLVDGECKVSLVLFPSWLPPPNSLLFVWPPLQPFYSFFNAAISVK